MVSLFEANVGEAAGSGSRRVVRAGLAHLDDLAPMFDLYRQFVEQPPDIESCRRFLAARLRSGDSVIFIAYLGDRAAGFTQIYSTFSSVSMLTDSILNDLYVLPEYRSRGVGTMLLKAAQEHCVVNGIKGLAIETGPENVGAQRLYRRTGWEDGDYRHLYWRGPAERAPAAAPIVLPDAEPGAVTVRTAERSDVPVILSFLRSKAEFDRCPDRMTATAADLEANVFADSPKGYVALAEIDGAPVGFATYFFTYGSFTARPGVWLDDLFVCDAHRGGGAGTALVRHVAQIAEAHGCARVDWIVNAANDRAIRFYEKCGASVLQAARLCRLNEAGMREIVGAE